MSRFRTILSLLACLLALAAAAGTARAQRSIFDDLGDGATGAVGKPRNAGPKAPKAGTVTGLASGAASITGGGSTPIPSADLLAKEERQVRDTFRADFARTAPADRAALAAKLLQQADQSPTSSTPRYVLLREARDVAAGAGAVDAAIQGADRIAETFAVDPLSNRLDTLVKLTRSTTAPEARQVLGRTALATFEEAQRLGKYEFIGRLAGVCDAAGQLLGPTALGAELRRKADTARSLNAEFGKAKLAAAKLKKNPADGDSAAAAGLFLCLAHDDWASGAPMLALSSNAAIKAAGAGEAANPTSPAAQLPLADTWVEVAKTQTGYLRTLCEARAVHWYHTMMPTAGEDARLQLQQKIETLPGQVAFSKIAAAVKASQTDKTRPAGAKTGGDAFTDVPEEGAVLTGLIVATKAGEILSIQPIYQSPTGRRLGAVHGAAVNGPSDRSAGTVTLEAIDGYAVSAIQTTGTDHLEALRLTFTRIRPTGLDSSSNYESDWIGSGKPAAPDATTTSEGKFAVGLHGATAPELKSIGIVRMR